MPYAVSTVRSVVDSSTRPSIRLLVILEGSTVSGPAKNLLEFCRLSKTPEMDSPVTVSFAIFVRGNDKNRVGATPANELLEALEATGAEVHCIHERFPFDPRVIGRLRQLVKSVAPDVIQTHFVKSHFLLRLSGAGRFCPWIAFHHGYTADATRTSVYNQLDRWSLRAPTRIIAVCDAFRQQLISRGVSGSRISVLHNGILPDWLVSREKTVDQREPAPGTEIASEHGLEKVVLAVGRLSKEKAFVDLIVAVKAMRELRPDLLFHLWIVGEGPERGSIERAVHDCGLQGRVKMVGYVRDVRPYYRMANVLAISSVSEGSPNVLLEAMAAGVPIAATCVGGIPEIVADRKTALLVEPGKPHDMAAAIGLLLSDSKLAEALVSNAREEIKSQYSPRSRTQFLLNLYEQIAPRPSAKVVQ
jgi:glycosyltransferase involved in cell wall biosynthesis